MISNKIVENIEQIILLIGNVSKIQESISENNKNSNYITELIEQLSDLENERPEILKNIQNCFNSVEKL